MTEQDDINRANFRKVVEDLQADGEEELDIRDIFEEHRLFSDTTEFDTADDEIVKFFIKQAQKYYKPTKKQLEAEVYYLKQQVNLLILYITQVSTGAETASDNFNQRLNRLMKVVKKIAELNGISMENDDEDDEDESCVLQGNVHDDEDDDTDAPAGDELQPECEHIDTPPIELYYVS